MLVVPFDFHFPPVTYICIKTRQDQIISFVTSSIFSVVFSFHNWQLPTRRSKYQLTAYVKSISLYTEAKLGPKNSLKIGGALSHNSLDEVAS